MFVPTRTQQIGLFVLATLLILVWLVSHLACPR
jgi:hypothetical protein